MLSTQKPSLRIVVDAERILPDIHLATGSQLTWEKGIPTVTVIGVDEVAELGLLGLKPGHRHFAVSLATRCHAGRHRNVGKRLREIWLRTPFAATSFAATRLESIARGVSPWIKSCSRFLAATRRQFFPGEINATIYPPVRTLSRILTISAQTTHSSP
jgi:hypothetical protein